MIKKCFIYGENLFYEKEKAKEKLKQVLLDLIENEDVCIFYNGRISNFDIMCEECLVELKRTHNYLELCYIYPYMFRALAKKMDYIKNIYDKVLEFNIISRVKRSNTCIDEMYMNFADISDYMITYLDREKSKVGDIINYAEKKDVTIKLLNYYIDGKV